MLKSCLVLSERLKNEYPGEIPAISLNALLQSAVSLNSKDLLHPSYDLVSQLKEKIEENAEIVAIDTMLKVMLGKYIEKQEYKIEIVEKIETLRDVENKFLELLNKYIGKRVMDSLKIKNEFEKLNGLGAFSLNAQQTIKTKVKDYPEINTENITDILITYAVGSSIGTVGKNGWFSIEDLFDEIKIREFSDKKNFKSPIDIKEIIILICDFLKKMIAQPDYRNFDFIQSKEVMELLLGGDLENIKKMKEIYNEFEKLSKIAQKLKK